ncbi:MAG: DUF2752 domain-containing protein [Myxococcales bacterium]|nr:DUF2752 domain-containing protein [Myxococcales bacterium]
MLAGVSPRPRPTLATRLAWSFGGLAALTVVALSVWLRPDPRGHGTHEQLGLAPCAFEAVTHIPCPGCGLTTSFSNMAHGHLGAAFGAHLMGPFLFALTLFVALFAPYALWRAYPVGALLSHRAAGALLSVTLAAGLVTFALRLAHHTAMR